VEALKEFLNDYMQTEVVGNTYIGTTANVVYRSQSTSTDSTTGIKTLFLNTQVTAEFRQDITVAQFETILESLNTIPLAFGIYKLDEEKGYTDIQFRALQEIATFEKL
jgi:hypothetical protein